MLHNLSMKLANSFFVKGFVQKEEDIEVYAYGLELLISTLASLLAVLILGACFGQFYPAIAFLLAFIPIRTYAGGYHAATHFRCFMTLMVVYGLDILLVAYLPQRHIVWIALTVSIISAVLVYWLSPIPDANKPISMEKRKNYREISIAIVSAQLFLVSVAVFLGWTHTALISFTYGQLAAALSLAAVKIFK